MIGKPKRGGARDGAGRPALPESDRARVRSIRMTDAEYALFKLRGGAKWLRRKLGETP